MSTPVAYRVAVELTYFWGLAGTLQAIVTPDLSAGFPQLEFFMFVVGHLGIVIAACTWWSASGCDRGRARCCASWQSRWPTRRSSAGSPARR